jgi:hypothetical protein
MRLHPDHVHAGTLDRGWGDSIITELGYIKRAAERLDFRVTTGTLTLGVEAFSLPGEHLLPVLLHIHNDPAIGIRLI